MNDYQLLTKLFTERNISWELHLLEAHHPMQLEVVGGYQGFCTIFFFNNEGKLEKIGAYE